ncbi:peroxiredoxin [Leucosporidium creatinivorum]|uniref:thioredoxin-dependent peroxiredoxin n=1 Tax=Leucosporidium creatinivorum TaxID=106004 RepID=A0A1Y2DKU1_9BASI|nr:peroxiredoxin [Leucosporidium creatinivorum]
MSARVQQPAPNFEATVVTDGFFETVKLEQFQGKWLVLFFYPMDWTFVCPTEILAFNAKLDEFAALNTEVLAVSCDSEYSHLAWANTARQDGGLGPDLKLKLVADKNQKIARDYGVLLEDAGVALRGLFLIDPKGTLRQITINDLPVGRSVEETIRLVKAFQFTDEHGEVCPASWDPETNASTIKTDPKAKLEYFKEQNPDRSSVGRKDPPSPPNGAADGNASKKARVA